MSLASTTLPLPSAIAMLPASSTSTLAMRSGSPGRTVVLL
jgi:hypothetical protein